MYALDDEKTPRTRCWPTRGEWLLALGFLVLLAAVKVLVG